MNDVSHFWIFIILLSTYNNDSYFSPVPYHRHERIREVSSPESPPPARPRLDEMANEKVGDICHSKLVSDICDLLGTKLGSFITRDDFAAILDTKMKLEDENKALREEINT